MERKIFKPKKAGPKKNPAAPRTGEAKKPGVKKAAAVKPRTAAKLVKPAAVQEFGLHNLSLPAGAHKHKKLLGRGSSSGHGKTSTRGSKGQTSRAGRHMYLGYEGGQTPLIRRMPKRGFTNIFRKEYQIVNLNDLNRIKAAAVDPEMLKEKGLIKDKGRLVKVLGGGDLKQPMSIKAHAFSKPAVERIKKAGGSAEVIPMPAANEA